MDHAVSALRGGVGVRVAADAALDELHVAADCRRVLAAAGGEVVEHADRMSTPQHVGRHVRPYKPGSDGDTNSRQTRLRTLTMQMSAPATEWHSAQTEPCINESRPTNACPSASSLSVKCEPMNPAQPMTTV